MPEMATASDEEGPAGRSGPSQHHYSNDDTRRGAELQEQLATFVACVLDPDDIVEVRRLPSKRSTWPRTADLPRMAASLKGDNRRFPAIKAAAQTLADTLHEARDGEPPSLAAGRNELQTRVPQVD